jgi:peptidoglycan/LPS O-acetylase OafA/YrhL
MRNFFLRNLKTLRTIRTVLAILLGTMIIIDIVLVMLQTKGYPTFSEVVKDQRSELIWLNFLLGGLVGKVFYNRIVYTKKTEISGFFAFLSIIVLLGILGQLEHFELNTWHHLATMLCGAIVGQRIWPQYISHDATDAEIEQAKAAK